MYTNQGENERGISYPDVVEDYGETITFDQTWLEDNYNLVRDFAEKYGNPIYVGEFGVHRWVPGGTQYLRDMINIFEHYGWNYAVYVWRGDEIYYDGFNMEYGIDPEIHRPTPENPLLNLFLYHWAQNQYFPSGD